MTVTIGSQTNVPDPGSPILSPWAQDTAKKLVHQFASATARDAWASPPDGAMCVTTSDDRLWQRKNAAWVEILAVDDADARYVNVTGDTMSGALVLGADPTAVAAAGIRIVAESGEQRGRIYSTIINNTANAAIVHLNRRPSTAGSTFIRFQTGDPASDAGSITLVSSTSVAYGTTSDRRLKTETGPVADPLARLLALRPISFTWPDGVAAEGFIADEVAPVVPWVVQGEPGAVLPADDEFNPGGIDPQQVNYPGLVPLLVAAVQELSARIEALEGGAT